MKKFYQGVFSPRHPKKYHGDPTKIIYRSHWEKMTFKWLDENPDIIQWSSEEEVVPYICATDGKAHRYFVDLKFTYKDGRVFYVEIKPKKETIQPKPGKRKTRRFVEEVMTFARNQSKWKYAEEYAKDRGAVFQVWTEETLKGLGIRILTG